MPLARNVPADRGLTVRMFVTGLLLVMLYGGFIAILWAVGLSFAVHRRHRGASCCSRSTGSPTSIALWSMHGHVVTPEQAPELHGIIDRLCALADMPKPRVAIADIDMPNAFATGRSPKAAVVCATTGPAAPARRARGRGGARARDLPRRPPRRRGDDDRQHARRDRRADHPHDALRRALRRLRRRAGRRQQPGRPAARPDRDGDHAGLDRRLRDQLPAHPGPVPLPRAGRRPLGGHPDRAARRCWPRRWSR